MMPNRQLILIMMLFLIGCQRHSTYSILPCDVTLRAGDVVFRQGSGLTSRAVNIADRQSVYSHVGIVAQRDGNTVIIHAVPSEREKNQQVDVVKMESPESFFSQLKANVGAVLRTSDSIMAYRASEYAVQMYLDSLQFDHSYDDSDTTQVYCCELVVRAYSKAGCQLIDTVRHHFRIPGKETINCILPSDIFSSDRLYRVITF